jgi:hypothetical protein
VLSSVSFAPTMVPPGAASVQGPADDATARTLDCSACGCEVAYHEMHPDFSRQVFVRNKLMRTRAMRSEDHRGDAYITWRPPRHVEPGRALLSFRSALAHIPARDGCTR